MHCAKTTVLIFTKFGGVSE